MNTTNKQKQILYIVLTLIFLVRLISINNPPLDYSSWRQVDTDSIARNFVEYRLNIFYPQLNYDGPMPNYAQLELQTTTFIIALLYKLFGYRAFLGRIVPVIFFMLSCCFLYMIGGQLRYYYGFIIRYAPYKHSLFKEYNARIFHDVFYVRGIILFYCMD